MMKRDKKQSAKRGKVSSRRSRNNLSVALAQRLGFEHENLAAADAALVGKFNLAKYMSRHPRIKKAYERGQFLRNLKGLAAVVMTVSEAAQKLSLASGEALREILDSDDEAADIWRQTRLDTILAAREALLTAAKEGNQTAIRAVENYLREEKQAATAGLAMDLLHLGQKEMCDLIAVTRMTLNDWEKRFGLPRNADKTYNLKAFLEWFGNFSQRRSANKIESADKLRDLKAAKMQVELAERRGELLDRNEVMAGIIARLQQIVGAFRYKRRELASMVHGQTVERIEDILARFFEDLQRGWLNVPEFLRLPPEAESKLVEIFDIIAEVNEVTKVESELK